MARHIQEEALIGNRKYCVAAPERDDRATDPWRLGGRAATPDSLVFDRYPEAL